MKQILFAFLITAALGVGGVALTFAFRTADASPNLFSFQELQEQEAAYRTGVAAEVLTVQWTPDQEAVERGRDAYNVRCMTCHGVNGDGSPVTPEGLAIRPRDFTGKSHVAQKVMFKFKSLNNADPLALDEDLKKTIREGLPGTPMPGFSSLSDEEINDLLEYIKTFAYPVWKFKQPEQLPVIETPPVPQDLMSQERVEEGRGLYASRGCRACHGDIEQGGNPLDGLVNDWLREGTPVPIMPRNFALDPLRRPGIQDIFKTIRLGIGGTPMPANALSDQETWSLIAYILELRQLGLEGKIPAS